MSKSKNRPKLELKGSELWIVRACLIVALGISVFLAWGSFQGGGVPGCGPESACDKVLSSRWGYIFGLPVSLFAIPVYVSLLILARPLGVNWTWLTPLGALVILSALWFVGIQAFALRAFCKFCMVAHAAGVIAALVLLRNTPLPPPKFAISGATAVLAAGALIAGQWLGPERGPTQIASTPPPIAPVQATNVAPPVPAPPPTFAIIDGEFTLDLNKVPVTGAKNAPKKVAKLFDYTCHHCRDLHHLLGEFRQKHSNELAVVSLPMPLDSECNPVVRRTSSAHVNACKYAAFGLAVFHANPEKFEAYTEFIFAPERPPELNRARDYAVELVGSERFEQALQNPAVGEQIRKDIEIYQAAYRKSRSGQMPQMYFERGASIGAVTTREQLASIMAQNLGIPIVQN